MTVAPPSNRGLGDDSENWNKIQYEVQLKDVPYLGILSKVSLNFKTVF